jgi:uncharacterized membrane protein YphA (DoxX/SURF4 family)
MTAGTNVDQTSTPKSAARFVPVIVRVLLGLGFTIFGLNGFLNFIPPPKEPMPEKAMAFASAMMNTGYMFKLVAGTQLVAGVLLLLNLFVPLALVLLMPIFVNIIAFHLFLAPAPSGFAPGIILLIMELYLAWVYRKAYMPMLVMKARPNEK